MTTCGCGKDCTCDKQPCSCCATSNSDGATYGTGDNQMSESSKKFSPEEIARLNDLFGNMDLTSPTEDEGTKEITDDDIQRLHKVFVEGKGE